MCFDYLLVGQTAELCRQRVPFCRPRAGGLCGGGPGPQRTRPTWPACWGRPRACRKLGIQAIALTPPSAEKRKKVPKPFENGDAGRTSGGPEFIMASAVLAATLGSGGGNERMGDGVIGLGKAWLQPAGCGPG